MTRDMYEIDELRPDGHPARKCTGNPDSIDFHFCGVVATHVAIEPRDRAHSQRFSCDAHVGDWQRVPVDEWWAMFDKMVEADDARDTADRLKRAPEP